MTIAYKEVCIFRRAFRYDEALLTKTRVSFSLALFVEPLLSSPVSLWHHVAQKLEGPLINAPYIVIEGDFFFRFNERTRREKFVFHTILVIPKKKEKKKTAFH